MDKVQRSGLVALVDMDGTIADYDSAIERDLKSLIPPDEAPTWVRNESQEHVKARIKLIRSQSGWWRKLAKLPDGFLLLDMLRKLGFNLNILTKGPFNHSNSWSEKVDWCREHVPDATITITEDKSLVYGKVLVDDWPPYVTGWLEYRPRGLVILPNRPWNQNLEHPQIVRYSNNLPEIEVRLQDVIRRSICTKE